MIKSITKTIRLHPDLAEKIEMMASDQGRSFNNMIIWLVKEQIDLIKKPN